MATGNTHALSSLTGIFKVPELTRKLFFTLGLLVVYRMGTFVTIPGIDLAELQTQFNNAASSGEALGKVMNIANMFSGGAISKASVFSLGIMPYITASILFQILTAMYPSLKKMQKDGESGRRKITQYTRYMTLAICLVQGTFLCNFLQTPNAQTGTTFAHDPGMLFLITGVVCMTTGTLIVMWLGEMITEFGLGNGISVIIMAGIIAELPRGLSSFWTQLMNERGVALLTGAFMIAFFLIVTIGIVYTSLGQRKIPIRQQRRAGSGSGAVGLRQYLPLRVNMANVIPIIFAQSILMLPAFAQNISFLKDPIQRYFSPNGLAYTMTYLFMIIFFSFFYTFLVFNPKEMSENMKEGGTFVPGIRPGEETANYFEILLVRITVIGATVLAVIAVIPQFLVNQFNIDYALAGIFGGTGLLIVVGVALDLIQKIDGHMQIHHFDSIVESPRNRT